MNYKLLTLITIAALALLPANKLAAQTDWESTLSDTLLCHNQQTMRFNFIRYIVSLDTIPSKNAEQSITRLMNSAAKDSIAYTMITDLAELCLSEPNSPLRNEDYYIMFLNAQINASKQHGYSHIRAAARLKTAMKNRPGTTAADFKYLTREGVSTSLRATKANRLLIVFYDPACEHCAEILHSLREDSLLTRLTAVGELKVLAVYTEGDRPLWNNTNATMPQSWTVAIDESGIVKNALYDIPAMPTLYLLDSRKRVLLKDPSLQALRKRLNDERI